jgi:hypothetical protein
MADPNIASIKSSLLKAISDHMDTIEREGLTSGARAAGRDLYSRNDPGDFYSRTTRLTALDPSIP